jgi:hypothetical protein
MTIPSSGFSCILCITLITVYVSGTVLLTFGIKTPENPESIPRINISNNTGNSVYPSIAAYGQFVYVVWEDDSLGASVSYNKKSSDILLKRSVDGGINFLDVTNLSNDSEVSARPVISAFEKNVYVVWIGESQGVKKLWFKKSMDGGTTFGNPMVLAVSDYTKDRILPATIAAFENNVYVTWRDLDSNGITGSILFKASENEGDSFKDTDKISSNAVYSSSPKVATYGKNVYVVWDVAVDYENKKDHEEGVFLLKSQNSGRSFDNPTRLNEGYEFGEAEVLANYDTVYIAWGGSIYNSQKKIGHIFLTLSFDDGNNFKNTAFIDDGFLNTENIDLALIENVINAVWQDKITGNGEIYFKTSFDKTKSLVAGKAINLSDNEGLSECPSVATSGTSTYVVWEDNTPGNHEILLSKLVAVGELA